MGSVSGACNTVVATTFEAGIKDNVGLTSAFEYSAIENRWFPRVTDINEAALPVKETLWTLGNIEVSGSPPLPRAPDRCA